MVIKHLLHVRPKCKSEEGVEIGESRAGKNACGAEGGRDTVMDERKLVKAMNHVGNHVCEQKARKAFERQAMSTCSQPLLDSADGPLDFAHVTAGRDKVQYDRALIIPQTFELAITM